MARPAELPVVVGGIQLVRQPQQVLLQHHALLQLPGQDRRDRRLAGAATAAVGLLVVTALLVVARRWGSPRSRTSSWAS